MTTTHTFPAVTTRDEASALADTFTVDDARRWNMQDERTPFFSLVLVRADRRLGLGICDARREATRLAREAADAEATARYEHSLTDAGLIESIAKGEADGPGNFRRAKILLGIHPDDRRAAVAAAHRFSNATPDAGRPSDALRSVASDFRRNPAQEG